VALRRRSQERSHELFSGFTDVYEIGVGSLATVYRAREIGTNRLVALKLLNVRDASPRAIESFERESVALGSLSSHPNIVTLYRNFRTPDGRPVLVLELCTGAVADRLHGGDGLPVQDAVAIGIKIAGALETAHRGGILHRDVKPQNILVTEFGEPALADFGVAMLQSSTQTTAGLFDFTTLHAAPELLEGAGTSAATDVYELASSLYQLIAGQSAFRAYEGESPASVILRILRDPVRPLSASDAPVQLSDLLIRAMSKDMDNRPPTAAEFAAELADVEIAEGWPRTQFLIRDTAGAGLGRSVTRMPDAVPRGLPSALGAMPAAIPTTPQPPPGPPPAPPAPAPAWAAPPPPPVRAEPEPVPEPEPEPEPVPEPEPAPEPEPEPTPVAETVPIAPVAEFEQRTELLPETATGPVAEAGPIRPADTVPAPEPEPPAEPEPEPVFRPVPEPAAAAPLEQLPVPPDKEPEPVVRRPQPGAPSWWAPLDAADRTAGEEQFPKAPAAASPETHVPEFPAPPTGFPAPSSPASVPIWATRSPTPAAAAAPQFVGDLSLDPTSLRPRLTVRSGTARLRVDDSALTLRTLFRKERLPWSQISRFEQHFPTGDAGGAASGVLLAITPSGAVELPATKRTPGELRNLHALLDAYRVRASARANR
jgi:hypothetical protein